MTQKGAAFISRSYFRNEVLLIHEHNYIVLFAFCVAGREQREELLLETPGITSLQAWYSRGCSEFLCLCPGDKVAPDRAQHVLADPISSPDKNFFPAAPVSFLLFQREQSMGRSMLGAGCCQTRSLSTSRFRGQQVQTSHLFKFCRSANYVQLDSHPGSNREWREVTQGQLIRTNSGSCLLSSVDAPAKGVQSIHGNCWRQKKKRDKE